MHLKFYVFDYKVLKQCQKTVPPIGDTVWVTRDLYLSRIGEGVIGYQGYITNLHSAVWLYSDSFLRDELVW